MANFVSHTHFCRHLFEFSGKVLILDGGLSLVKCRKLLPNVTDIDSLGLLAGKNLKSVWEFSKSVPRNPGENHTEK